MGDLEWAVTPNSSRILSIAPYLVVGAWEGLALCVGAVIAVILAHLALAGAWTSLAFLLVVLLIGSVGLLGYLAVYLVSDRGLREVHSVFFAYFFDLEYLNAYMTRRRRLLAPVLGAVGYSVVFVGAVMVDTPLQYLAIIALFGPMVASTMLLRWCGTGRFDRATGHIEWESTGYDVGWKLPLETTIDTFTGISVRSWFGISVVTLEREGRMREGHVLAVPADRPEVLEALREAVEP